MGYSSNVDPLCLDPVLNRTLQPKPIAPDEKILVGLDLGQSQDFTAMVTLFRRTVITETGRHKSH
jgi:phage terminase large subunit-like protein